MFNAGNFIISNGDHGHSSSVEFIGEKARIELNAGIVCLTFSKGVLSGQFTATEDSFVESVAITGVIPVPIENAVFLKNGFQSLSYSGSLGPDDVQKRPSFSFLSPQQENVKNFPSGRRGIHVSELFCFIGSASDGGGVLIAQSPPFRQFMGFRFDFNAGHDSMEIKWDLGKKFRRGESILLDPVSFTTGKCCDLLEKWADSVSIRKKIRFNSAMRTGWSSRNYYRTKISAEIILENLEFAAQNKIPFDFFRIDDGYRTHAGDWLSLTEGFDGRMREISDAVRAAGFTPGIRVSPFVTSKEAPAFSHAGWVLRDAKGKPVTAGRIPDGNSPFDLPVYALDVTHPDVQAYIRTVITTMREDWGFDYFTLDVLHAAALPGIRHDRSFTRADILNLGLSLIRESAGDDAILHGCSAPLSASIGLVDAMSVGCEISQSWNRSPFEQLLHSVSSGTKDALRNSLVRSFMNKRFWISAPGCLILPCTQTKLSAEERRSLYNAVMTEGEMAEVSDDLSRYGEKETKDLSRALALFSKTGGGKVCTPDILENKIPEIVWNDKGYLSVFNFHEYEAEKILSSALLVGYGIKAKTVTDIETGEKCDVTRGIRIKLAAHDSRMFKVSAR